MLPSRTPILGLLSAAMCAFFLSWSAPAQAAWPDGYPGRVKNLEALRYDMAWPGVVYDAAQVAARYDEACKLKSSSACNWQSWQGSAGGDLGKAAASYKKRCPSDPQACVVLGWSKTRDDKGRLAPGAPQALSGMSDFKKACDKAYAGGCTGMGEMYREGVGVSKDLAKARKLFVEACSAKDAWGCYQLGSMYERGEGVTVDLRKAGELYGKSCKAGVPHACVGWATLLEDGRAGKRDPQKAAEIYGNTCNTDRYMGGCYQLGRIYSEGRIVERNMPVAEQLFKSSCDGGDLLGCFGMATMYESGRSKEGDAEDAAKIYEEACNIGHADACTRLGKLYLRGRGVPKDVEIGSGFIKRACEGGNWDACDVMGQLYEAGNGVNMNLTKATELYTTACEDGGGRACYHLAQLYKVGKGVKEDRTKAGELYNKACTDGHGKSCGLLARAYITGDGVKKDPEAAAELLSKGCGGGDGESCAKLGGMLQGGNGVAKDPVRAVQLYQEACALEHGMACHYLAGMYERGDGTEQDFSKAVKAYKAACQYGYEKACSAGGTVIFQASFQDVLDIAFESKMCQVWSFDPEKPDKARLVVDVRGSEFAVMDGPRKGETIKLKHLGNDFQTTGVFKGLSKWEAASTKGALTFQHAEVWDSEEDPIDAFPGDASFSPERAGETTLVYSREEEMVKRNMPNKKCKFGSGYPLLTSEHCSAVQSLLAAQLISQCKGD